MATSIQLSSIEDFLKVSLRDTFKKSSVCLSTDMSFRFIPPELPNKSDTPPLDLLACHKVNFLSANFEAR